MPDRKYIAVSAVLLVLICYALLVGRQGPFVEIIDYGEHAASILEMSENLFSPQNPMLPISGDTTLRYTPYIFIAGLIKKILHLELETTLAFISFFSFIILIAGVYLFSVQYFRNRDMPVYLLIVLLFFWGRPFLYSNDYSFNFIAYTLFYPSIITFNLGFIGFYLIIVWLEKLSGKFLIYYILLSVFLFLTHPLTASFYLLTCFIIALTHQNYWKKGVLLVFAVFGVSLILAILWPYYPFLTAFNRSMTTEWYQHDFKSSLYDPFNIFIGACPAILGLPLAMRCLIKRENLIIPWGLFSCILIYIISFILDINLGERYIFFILFFLHLAIAVYLCQLNIFCFNTWQNILAQPFIKSVQIFIFSLLLAGCILIHAGNVLLQQSGYSMSLTPPFVYKYTDPIEEYRKLRPFLKKDDIVLSDPLSMWLLPAITGVKIVALYHDNPLVTDNNHRIYDLVNFYKKDTLIELRQDIIKKYDVTHVVLNFDRGNNKIIDSINLNFYEADFKADDKMLRYLNSIGEPVFNDSGLMLFKINSHLINQ